MTATFVCAYPGCEITSSLERCSECGKIACPQHRTLHNDTDVCLMCDEARVAKAGEAPSGYQSAATPNTQATPIAVKPGWKIRPAIFGLGLLSLFLPFVSVSCNGQPVGTATGIQLATGFETSDVSPSSNSSNQSVVRQFTQREGSEPLAVLVIVVVLIGIGFGFWHSGGSAILSALTGIVGVITLIGLRSKIASDVKEQGGRLFQVDYRAGFWLLLSLFVAATLYNAYLFLLVMDGEFIHE